MAEYKASVYVSENKYKNKNRCVDYAHIELFDEKGNCVLDTKTKLLKNEDEVFAFLKEQVMHYKWDNDVDFTINQQVHYTYTNTEWSLREVNWGDEE